MIVPMKKIAIIVQSKDAVSAIDTLRSAGILHVEHQQAPKGKDIRLLKDDIALANKAAAILSSEEYRKKAVSGKNKRPGDWKFTAGHIIGLKNRLGQLEEYSRALINGISKWKSWGDFNPGTIKHLGEEGVRVRLYQIPVKEMNPVRDFVSRSRVFGISNGAKKLPADVIVKKLAVVRGIANCAVISRGEHDIPFNEIALPKMSLNEMEHRLLEDKQAMHSIKDELQQHVCYCESFSGIKKSLEKELEFQQALRGMGQSGKLMYLTGYIPFDAVESLRGTAKKEKWGILVKDPADDDNVPTLIRNPRWVSIIAPIFKVIEIIPGYKELDISLWFLLFFSIFFGMLIGDAGYGMIFFAATLLAQKKFGKKLRDKSVFILFYILSSCAIIWGVLSGTFFGQEWLPQWIRPLIPALRESKNVESLCFLLGAIHLSVAHLWRSVIKLPSPKALADFGWTVILWGAYFLANMLILGDTFPAFGGWLFISGTVLVILFTNPSKNILKGIGAGFGSLLLNFVNTFTDIVSYIRLFAVGLATVAIADAFNRMAVGIGYNSVLTGAATSLILLLGHTLNIVLGPLAILVHGVRLNVLEFCSHLDIKWSGFSYKPLEK